MSTRRLRRAAARANGKKSAGPATPVHATSPTPAFHSRLADSICLTIERREEFSRLHQAYISLHAPSNPVEHLIVEEMVVARWRLQRTWVIDTGLLENQMDEMTDQVDKEYETMDESRWLTLAFKDLAEKSPSLSLLQRYESRLSRQIQRCQKQLAELRAISGANPNKTLELSNVPNDPNPGNEHCPDPAEHLDSAPQAAPPHAQAASCEPQRPADRPALAAPALDLLPVGPEPADSQARAGLPPSFPRAA
jgi:hypothetical protein